MTVLVPVPGGSAAAIVQPIQASLPGTVLVATPNGKNIVVSGPPTLVARARNLIAAITDIPLGSALPGPVTIGVSNWTPSELLQKLAQTGLTDAPVVAIADDAHNRLLVRAPDSALEHIKAAVALDRYSRREGDLRRSSASTCSPPRTSNVGILFGGVDSTGKVSTGSSFTAFANRLLPLNATINALIADGAATVLARPSVAVPTGRRRGSSSASISRSSSPTGGSSVDRTCSLSPSACNCS